MQDKNYRGCTNFTGGARKKFLRASRALKILHPLAKCLCPPLAPPHFSPLILAFFLRKSYFFQTNQRGEGGQNGKYSPLRLPWFSSCYRTTCKSVGGWGNPSPLRNIIWNWFVPWTKVQIRNASMRKTIYTFFLQNDNLKKNAR